MQVRAAGQSRVPINSIRRGRDRRDTTRRDVVCCTCSRQTILRAREEVNIGKRETTTGRVDGGQTPLDVEVGGEEEEEV